MAATRSKTNSAEKKTLDSNISAMIKEEVSAFLKSDTFKDIVHTAITEAMNKCLAQYVEPLQDEVKSLKVSVGKLEEELGKAKLVVEPLEEKILILERKVADMSCDLSRVGLKANDNEQYSRRYNVRVFGCVEEESEKCSEKLVNLCRDKLELDDFSVDKIDRCHRVGKLRSGGKPRAIIVRLKSYEAMRSVMHAKKKLKGTPYFISEDLTRLNQHLYLTARKDCLNVSSVWSMDGKIFVKRQLDNRIIHIVQHEDFSNYDLV